MLEQELETHDRQSAMKIVAALPIDEETALRILAYATELVAWRPAIKAPSL